MKRIDVRSKKEKRISVLLAILLILGMLISLFLLYAHFAPEGSKYCNLGDSLNCDRVNKSPYANLDGISFLLIDHFKLSVPLVDISGINNFYDFITTNAFLGFLVLLFLFLLLIFSYKRKNFLWIRKEKSDRWMRGILLFSLLYAIYLLYIQHSVLKTYCVFCLSLDAIIILVFIITWFVKDDI